MNKKDIASSLALVAACLLVFGGALRHDFVRFDDSLYITENPRVRAGLSWEGVRWAFFGLLTLPAYERYARRGGMARCSRSADL